MGHFFIRSKTSQERIRRDPGCIDSRQQSGWTVGWKPFIVPCRKVSIPAADLGKRGVKNVFYVYIFVGYLAHSFQGPSKDSLTSSEDRLSWNNSERIFFWCHSSLFLCHPLHLCPGGRRGIFRRAFSHPSSSNGIVSVHFYDSILMLWQKVPFTHTKIWFKARKFFFSSVTFNLKIF